MSVNPAQTLSNRNSDVCSYSLFKGQSQPQMHRMTFHTITSQSFIKSTWDLCLQLTHDNNVFMSQWPLDHLKETWKITTTAHNNSSDITHKTDMTLLLWLELIWRLTARTESCDQNNVINISLVNYDWGHLKEMNHTLSRSSVVRPVNSPVDVGCVMEASMRRSRSTNTDSITQNMCRHSILLQNHSERCPAGVMLRCLSSSLLFSPLLSHCSDADEHTTPSQQHPSTEREREALHHAHKPFEIVLYYGWSSYEEKRVKDEKMTCN